jgi:3-deoxy-7-phosphoheptulonate synthase
MSFDWLTENLPTPCELKKATPLSLAESTFVQKSRITISQILEGTDPRKLLIVGPCSVHDIDSTIEYAKKLKQLSDSVLDSFFIVMRVYFEKPRTALGWKGYVHDPYLNGSHYIEEGLSLTRGLLKKLTQEEMPIASEFLDPAIPNYLADYVSWGCVGARTVSSQIHRQMASHLPMPIGFKNSIDGNIETALHAIEVAQMPHTFIGMSDHGRLSVVRSFGNPLSHLVLRGGENGPNYSHEKVQETVKRLEEKKLSPRLIIDCSHDNSRKKHFNQITVYNNVIDQMQSNSFIKGLMLESFIVSGQQRLSPFKSLVYGQSITDSCLDFATTESLILSGSKKLSESQCVSTSSSA